MTELEYTKLVARNIRHYMNINGKTQAEVAKDLHLSKATVSSWVNGTRLPRMEKIDMLCSYFNIRRADLMEEHSFEEVPKTGQQTGYYFDEETAKLAQELKDNPELRVLLDASRDITPDEMRAIINLVKTMKGNNND